MSDGFDQIIIAAVMFVLGLCWTAWALRDFIVDLKFYSQNDWDFEKDSGIEIRYGYGFRGDKISAEQRFKHGHLISIGLGLVFLLIPPIFFRNYLLSLVEFFF
jgi:hypothetical protein